MMMAGRRRLAEGDRQQQRDGRHRPDPRQHADGGADQRAQQREAEVLDRKRDAEAVREVG
jgi:hypothetical protein